MKIAHLILAHSEPRQLARLMDALEHEEAYFFLHIDQKADARLFGFLAERARTWLVQKRVKVSWGAYSIVQATLNAFREIANSEISVDYVNLLSGSDYPLKSTEEIHSFFEKNKEKNFLEYQSVTERWTEAIPRLTEYHLTNYQFPGKYLVQKWVNRLLPARSMPNGLVPVGRSQWMSITIDAVRYILDYMDRYPNVARYFKLTWAPDEILFQTILYNSSFQPSLVNDNLRYIDWSNGKASPKVLTEDDRDQLLQSPALFARKFDMARHPGIMDELDRKIQNHPI